MRRVSYGKHFDKFNLAKHMIEINTKKQSKIKQVRLNQIQKWNQNANKIFKLNRINLLTNLRKNIGQRDPIYLNEVKKYDIDYQNFIENFKFRFRLIKYNNEIYNLYYKKNKLVHTFKHYENICNISSNNDLKVEILCHPWQ